MHPHPVRVHFFSGIEDRGSRIGDRGSKDKGQRTKDKGQRTKDKGQRTKDEGQGTRDEGQRTKDKGQGTKGHVPLSTFHFPPVVSQVNQEEAPTQRYSRKVVTSWSQSLASSELNIFSCVSRLCDTDRCSFVRLLCPQWLNYALCIMNCALPCGESGESGESSESSEPDPPSPIPDPRSPILHPRSPRRRRYLTLNISHLTLKYIPFVMVCIAFIYYNNVIR